MSLAVSPLPPLAPSVVFPRVISHHRSPTLSGHYWSAGLFILFSHVVIAWMLACRLPVAPSVLAYSFFQAWLNLLGITAGAHRLWSHRSYEAHWALRIFLAIAALQAFQGSVRWWALKHRCHHRWTDSPLDPHSAKLGLWHSHMAWLLKPPVKIEHFERLVPGEDLRRDPVLYYQSRFLLLGYLLFGGLLPAFQGFLLAGDFVSGFLWIGFFARFVSWHCIWTINSLSHWVGEKKYSAEGTAVRAWWVGILQNGEGHHNYHHEIPWDFRHGIGRFDYDPTKWCILAWEKLGLAWNLRRADEKIINKAIAETIKAQLAHYQPALQDVEESKLPELKKADLKRIVKAQRLPWLIIDGLVIDCTAILGPPTGPLIVTPPEEPVVAHALSRCPQVFNVPHPGGSSVLLPFFGCDASAEFHGRLNRHTATARAIMKNLAIARLVE